MQDTERATITLPADTAAETLRRAADAVRSPHMTPIVLAQRAQIYAGNVDSARWALADLALEAKRANVKDWPEVIGKVVRRRPRTIRQWSQVADFHQATGHIDGLDFSFWAVALRFADKVAAELIVELMHTAVSEGVGVEEFEAELRAMAGAPDPDPAKRWRKLAEKLYGEVDSYVPEVGDVLKGAARLLDMAADNLALEQAKAAGAVQPEPITSGDVADAILERRERKITPTTSVLEGDLLAALAKATDEVNASGDGSMTAKLYHHGSLVTGG